jgi:hypothetical protein
LQRSETFESFAASLTAFAFMLGIDGPKIFCRGPLISVARQRNRRSRSLREVTLGEVTTSVTRLSGRLATANPGIDYLSSHSQLKYQRHTAVLLKPKTLPRYSQSRAAFSCMRGKI